ncbi:MAG: AraC family transcriptional regulator [Gemmatimonadota bacterium]
MTDYLAWRGIVVERDTTQLIRRIVELSADLRTVTALARGMYMSRRALGRRLMTRGLPVPSHWLQVARILRVAARLQNTDTSILSLAYQSGYPDGFSMSNQMHRLIGYRPSQMREYLGWEWIFEAWLRREAEAGGLSPSSVAKLQAGPKASAPPPASFPPAKPGRPRRGRNVA